MEMPETSTSLPDIVRDRRDTTVTPVKWTQLLPKPSLILYNNRLIAGGALNRGRAGDDDYVSKPFSPRELVARVKAILKRSAGTTASLQDVLALGALRLDRAAHSVTWSETLIALTALKFSALASLDQLTRLVARMRELAQAEMPLAQGTSTLQSVLPDLKAQFPQLFVSAARAAAPGWASISCAPCSKRTVPISHLCRLTTAHAYVLRRLATLFRARAH